MIQKKNHKRPMLCYRKRGNVMKPQAPKEIVYQFRQKGTEIMHF